MTDEPIPQRIAREAGFPRPADLLAQVERQPALQPSSADARLLREVDGVAFTAATGFTALEMAPACPSGTSAVLGGIHPNSVLTTVRGSEVLLKRFR